MRSGDDYVILHPAVIRVCHWIWAAGILLLIGSGFQIYNQEPLFDFYFPSYLIIGNGDESVAVHNDIGLAAALLVHFFAMWLLFTSLSVYVAYGLVKGHFRRKFLPIWPKQVIGDVFDFLRGRLSHDLGTRNAVQKLLYTFAVVAMAMMVWSGLVLWKPIQFYELSIPLGGYDIARYVHFFGMVAIVLFIIVHVALTLMVPKVLPPMITGRARRDQVEAHAQGETP